MNKKITRSLLLIALVAIFTVGATAQEVTDRMRPSIRVTGDAIVSARPDQAQIDVGVVTQASTAKAAADENARKVDAVLAALRKVLGPDAEIKTVGYSLNPNYVYPPGGGQPRINGFTASNIVQVKTKDLTQVGTIIDTASQNGANNIQSLQFTLKDDQAVRAQALREAAAKARTKAETLASALGVRVVRILLAEESGPVVMPIYARAEMMQAKASDVSTPVEPGTIEVRASVILTVEIAQ